MPLIETAPDALARLYARSLYDLAESQGGAALVEQVLGELEDILEIARSDAKFSEFLSSRILPMDARARSLSAILGGRTNNLTLNFLQILNRKERLGHLPAMVAALDQMVQEAFGRVEVDLYTAAPVESETIDQIRNRLREVLGKEPVVHPYTDPSMIGGLKMQIGDKLIDASVATRLRRLRDQLYDHGAAQVRAKSRSFIDDASRPSDNGDGH